MTSLIYTLIIFISAFEYRGGEPGSLFPFMTAAGQWSVPGIYLNPLSVPDNRGLTLSFYGSRPYSENELHSYTSGVKYSSSDWGAQLLWHSFGTGFYRENSFTAGGGFCLSGILTAACSMTAYRLNVDADDVSYNRTMYDIDAGAGLRPASWIYISFMQNSVFTAATGKQGNSLYPERSAGILLFPVRGFSLSWNLTDTAAGYINSFTAEILPSGFLSIRGGYTPEDSRLAASVSVIMKSITASYSLSSHPYLGYTHAFGITYSCGSETETVVQIRRDSFTPEKTININRASPDEIRKIPFISVCSAERIILYRDKIGPVSERSLRQIGLNEEEIDSVKNYCFGLARSRSDDSDDDRSFKSAKPGRKIYISYKERTRERFRKLVKEGIDASSAIRYSELPLSTGRNALEEMLSADSTLTEEQKDAVRRTCSE